MSEIKPVYQLRVRFNLWEDQTKEQYEDSKFGDGVPRILYPAAAYEALQKENDQWKTVLDCNEQIRVGQAKRIAELESELVEWNEFKKIRDVQMQALRKQMP